VRLLEQDWKTQIELDPGMPRADSFTACGSVAAVRGRSGALRINRTHLYSARPHAETQRHGETMNGRAVSLRFRGFPPASAPFQSP